MDRAKIGDIEISVVSSESLSNKMLVTEKPVEKGENVADHTKKQPISITLTGAVIGEDAGGKLSKLMKLQKEGKLIKYIHRNALNNMVVEDINSIHDTKTRNGFTFNIRLKQVRIATAKEVEIVVVNPVTKTPDKKTNTAVKEPTNNGLQQPYTQTQIEMFKARDEARRNELNNPSTTHTSSSGRVHGGSSGSMKDIIKTYKSSSSSGKF